MIGISQPSSIILGAARFQRDYLWDIILPDIGILGGLIGFTLGQLVQTVSFGDYNLETSTMRFGPYGSHFAGTLEIEKVQMTFLKTVPDVITAYFGAWKNMIMSSNGTYYPKNNYARTIYIRFNDSTGLAIGQYKLLGAFPIAFPSYNLSYDSEKAVHVEIEFQIDRIESQLF